MSTFRGAYRAFARENRKVNATFPCYPASIVL